MYMYIYAYFYQKKRASHELLFEYLYKHNTLTNIIIKIANQVAANIPLATNWQAYQNTNATILILSYSVYYCVEWTYSPTTGIIGLHVIRNSKLLSTDEVSDSNDQLSKPNPEVFSKTNILINISGCSKYITE